MPPELADPGWACLRAAPEARQLTALCPDHLVLLLPIIGGSLLGSGV